MGCALVKVAPTLLVNEALALSQGAQPLVVEVLASHAVAHGTHALLVASLRALAAALVDFASGEAHAGLLEAMLEIQERWEAALVVAEEVGELIQSQTSVMRMVERWEKRRMTDARAAASAASRSQLETVERKEGGGAPSSATTPDREKGAKEKALAKDAGKAVALSRAALDVTEQSIELFKGRELRLALLDLLHRLAGMWMKFCEAHQIQFQLASQIDSTPRNHPITKEHSNATMALSKAAHAVGEALRDAFMAQATYLKSMVAWLKHSIGGKTDVSTILWQECFNGIEAVCRDCSSPIDELRQLQVALESIHEGQLVELHQQQELQAAQDALEDTQEEDPQGLAVAAKSFVRNFSLKRQITTTGKASQASTPSLTPTSTMPNQRSLMTSPSGKNIGKLISSAKRVDWKAKESLSRQKLARSRSQGRIRTLAQIRHTLPVFFQYFADFSWELSLRYGDLCRLGNPSYAHPTRPPQWSAYGSG